MISNLAHFLNEYANLLLVIANFVLVAVTAVYVWLTWHSLNTLRETSLRDREALHLQEVKDHVIQPIVSWIRGTVFARYTGQSPELLGTSGGYGGITRQFCHTIDDPYTGRQRLSVPGDTEGPDLLASWVSTESGRIHKFLYEHTRDVHFGVELREFDRFLNEVRELTGAVISLATECARDVASQEIPQAKCSDDENSMTEWTKPHVLTTVSIKCLLQNENTPRIEFREHSGQGFHLHMNSRNEPIAKAMQTEKLKHWSELGFEKVRRRWESNNFPGRIAKLLKDAEIVSCGVEKLLFTHSLGVDCELVSGRRRGWKPALFKKHKMSSS